MIANDKSGWYTKPKIPQDCRRANIEAKEKVWSQNLKNMANLKIKFEGRASR